MAEERLEGIGGWLILVIIGLFINGIIYLYDLATSLSYADAWGTSPTLMFFLILLDLFAIVTIVYTLISLFNKKKKTKGLVIFYLWLIVCLNFIVLIIVYDESSIRQFSLSIVAGIIWTLYFNKSERVKNTFRK